jgi:hypothetical protein
LNIRNEAQMSREVVKATGWGLGSTAILGALILIGSRNLAHFDALVAYTAAVLFATFGLTAMWLQRPSTAVYWKRGWQTFFQRGHHRIDRRMAGKVCSFANRAAWLMRSKHWAMFAARRYFALRQMD